MHGTGKLDIRSTIKDGSVIYQTASDQGWFVPDPQVPGECKDINSARLLIVAPSEHSYKRVSLLRRGKDSRRKEKYVREIQTFTV